ncbi:MAG: tetratricopeptide repeat protein [Planctomycetota bacterium]|nr:tetratricopeptide repeat protein [Planctomycetota bacterium]
MKPTTTPRTASPYLACLLGLCLVGPGLPGECRAQTGGSDGDIFLEDCETAEQHYLKGRFSKARSLFEEVVDAFEEEVAEDRPGPEAMRRARRGLLLLELDAGDYRRVLKMFAGLPTAERGRAGSALLAVRAQVRTGEYESAIATLRGLVGADKGGAEVQYRLGRSLELKGQIDAARQVYTALIADAAPVDPLDKYYVARSHMALGGRKHFESASYLLRDAIRAAPERPEARTAFGELAFAAYRESKGRPHAEKYIKPVLEQNGEVESALLVLYRARSFNMFLDGGKTAELLDRALVRNPNSVPAMNLRASRLIDDRLFESGAAQLDKALAVNPRDRTALAHRAAVAHLLHDEASEKEYRQRAKAGHPGYADLERVYGDHLVALYRFQDSLSYYRAALAIDADNVPAMHGLAKALVYTGKGGEAVEWLSKAKSLEPGHTDAWRANILISERLLAKEYDAFDRGHFRFVVHKADRAVLEDYLSKWFEDAYEYLGNKYGYKPQNKVRVEVLHEWVDFSVRTIGFRGFSALGACFGEFVTMVSPSDDLLRKNDFMWSATAWHEYAHVLTLALSKHRVPRWLTEGLSVYEESAKNRSWERGMQRELLDAYHNEDIPPLRLLNRLFRGGRILFGYYQGGLTVEYLAEQHGFKHVVSMLKAYGDDQGTEQIFRKTFGYSTREFDKRFRKWILAKKLRGLKLLPRLDDKGFVRMRGRVQDRPGDLDAKVRLGFGHIDRQQVVEAGIQAGAVLRSKPDHPLANVLHAEILRLRKKPELAMAAFRKAFQLGAESFEARMHFGQLLEAGEDLDAALRQYQAAKACWPQCTDQASSPMLKISNVLTRQGKRTEAMMEVKAFCERTARAFDPRVQLANYERELGNHKAAAAYLEQAIQIDPFMRSLHEQLGDAYLKLGRPAEARREYEVGLAVPTDMDRAHLAKPPAERPALDSEDEGLARGALCVKIARVSFGLGDKKAAAQYLGRAEAEAPDSPVSDEVHELRAKWKL